MLTKAFEAEVNEFVTRPQISDLTSCQIQKSLVDQTVLQYLKRFHDSYFFLVKGWESTNIGKYITPNNMRHSELSSATRTLGMIGVHVQTKLKAVLT